MAVSNRAKGNAVKNLDYLSYFAAHGGIINVDDKSSTFAKNNIGVFKYFSLLRDYTLNRVRWTSPQIDEYELRLIEWHIFNRGFCAMLRPKIYLKNVKNLIYEKPEYMIYPCSFTKTNPRNGRVMTISIDTSNIYNIIIEPNYNHTDFTIFTHNYLQSHFSSTYSNYAWEYANKIFEVDLSFNANARKMRMPFIFNNGEAVVEINGKKTMIERNGLGVEEIIRSAMEQNEGYVGIQESMVGEKSGFMFEPQHVENFLSEYADLQKSLYNRYLEVIGLYTLRDRTGVYTIKELQEQAGDQTGDYITSSYMRSRLLCAREAAEKFGITLKMELM